MNSAIVNNTPTVNSTVNTNDVKVKAPRKPSLPAKYSKFMQFGFWFMAQMNETNILSSIEHQTLLEKLLVFDSVEAQSGFYERFIASSKDASKTMRKAVASHKKDLANAAKPPKLSRAKKNVNNVNTENEKKSKKNNKKNTVVSDLASELISLAQNVDVSSTTATVTVPVTLSDNITTNAVPKAKRVYKRKTAAESAPVVAVPAPVVAVPAPVLSLELPVEEPVPVSLAPVPAPTATTPAPVQEKKKRAKKDSDVTVTATATATVPLATNNSPVVSDKKPRAKKEKETKPKVTAIAPVTAIATHTVTAIATHTVQLSERPSTPLLPNSDDDSESDELDVRELILDGVSYWIDDNTANVFKYDDQSHIGTFNSQNNKIELIVEF